MNKTKNQLLLLISGFITLYLFAFNIPIMAQTLYVATNGSNTAPYDTWGKAATSIQAAINAASDGDIIIVGSSDTGHGDGVYKENVDVNKSLTIKSESGSENTTVKAANAGDHVFEVTANNVTIGGKGCGFSIYGATGYYMAGIYLGSGITDCTIQDNRCGWDDTHNNNYGIYLYDSDNNTLTGNTASSNADCGIYLDYSCNANTLTGNTASSNNNYGIYLYESGNNTLTVNTASSNYNGIYLYDSDNNTLTGNTADNNEYYGILLSYSSNDTLTDNTMSGNQYNFSVEGELLSDYTHNIDESNMVESKPIYYWVNQQNKQIPSDAGYVGIVNSNNIIVKDLTLENNGEGVLFAYTAGSRIENVNASNNNYGIYLYSSSNNTLTGNTASSNNYYGIYLYYYSNNNTIYLNNLPK